MNLLKPLEIKLTERVVFLFLSWLVFGTHISMESSMLVADEEYNVEADTGMFDK